MNFKTIVIHVDDETGEILCKWDAIEKYIEIKNKKIKHVTINKECFRGTITITKFYRKQEYTQQTIPGL